MDDKLQRIIKIICDQDWRSADEEYDYGYGGEVYSYHPHLYEEQVEPVARAILAALNEEEGEE